MNALVKNQVKRIEQELENIRALLAKYAEDNKKQHAEKEELLQEQWRQRNELVTLRRVAEDYDRVDDERQRIRDQRGEIRERLQRILAHSKALSGLYKP